MKSRIVRGEEIRAFILENAGKHPTIIANLTGEKFGISRQAVSKHLRRLVSENALDQSGATRKRAYFLTTQSEKDYHYTIQPELAEDIVWRDDISPNFDQLPKNVRDLWQHGFTEMFNNAIDHSEGKDIFVTIHKNALGTELTIMDDGVGVFKKIQSEKNLADERHAVLELSKGKLTTDPKRHSGEGIFFTSRMFDEFFILSGDVGFSHDFGRPEDWIMNRNSPSEGTNITMKLKNNATRTCQEIFGKFTSGSDFSFSKTVVPVRLAQYGDDQLISRSQAKRVLTRIELFKVVVFDFREVEIIGQAFADEMFRVFAKNHPEIQLIVLKANKDVNNMINRVTRDSKKDD